MNVFELHEPVADRARCDRGPLALLAAMFLCFGVSAADKNGVSPNAISLPTGPGSIEGLGESFQPTLNTGTASYRVALSVPPGTAGHAPILSLTYEGGGANGPLGFGWSLPVRYVQRQCDKGIPRYVDGPNGIDDDLDGELDEADEVDPFINEMKEELVPQADGHYFCENEGAFIRYRRNGDHWEGTLPNGTRLEFGLTPDGRITEPALGRVFCWLLEKETDTHGNTIVYTHRPFPGPANTNQKYCAGIAYGPGPPPWENFHFVSFVYEDRSDWFEDGRAGFVVRTGKRLKEIVVGTQGPSLPAHLAGDFNLDGATDYLVRKYVLKYLEYAPPDSHWSLLSELLRVGADGTNSLPPGRFGYAVCNPPQTVSANGAFIGGINEPFTVMDNPLVDLVDLNADALPDVLKTEQFGGAHIGYLNQGEFTTNGTRSIRWSPAAEVGSADGLAWNVNLEAEDNIAHLSDMDGDGLADLVYKSTIGDVFFFANQGGMAWGTRKPMSIQDSAPPSPFGNSEVRRADIDFDKRMDVIQTVSTGSGADYRVWFNLGNQRYSRSVTVPQASGVPFSLKGVHVADFNGDRVPDIVRLQPASLTVTAGLGYGVFADAITVNLPDFTLDSAQVEKAVLQDITGDGLTDLVIERALPGQLWYWINKGNYTVTVRHTITSMPTALGLNAVTRWADLNGNGTVDLIYADSAAVPRLAAVDIGELIGCVPRPNILTSIDNGIGRKFTIKYEPSTKFALEDAGAGNPWPDPLPFPVTVVAEVLTDDSLGHTYITRYRYHNGYYDGVEKEFRGFGRAEQIEVGDPTAPTLVSRSHFDTGRNFEAMKGKLLRATAEQEDGKVFWNEVTSWTSPPKTLMTGINGQTVNYAHPTGKSRLITELGQGAPRQLEVEYAYDNYGNRTLNADYGIVVNGNREAFDDERVTTTDYALNPQQWILRHPRRQEIKDENGMVISRSEHFYDDETFSGNNFGQVTIGNLTLRREWIRPQDPTAFIATARTRYDSYGNAITLLDPLAEAPGGTINAVAGHYREVTYDGRFHTYPVRETIHVGGGQPLLVMEVGYDEGFATVAFSRDFNGHETAYGYDVFARLTRVIKPGDTPAYPTLEYDYFLAHPFGAAGLINYTETRMLDKGPGTAGPAKRDHYFISRQFVDGLGRGVMTMQEAEPDANSGSTRVVVEGAVLFNARREIAQSLNSYFSLKSATNLDSLLDFEDVTAPGWQGAFHTGGQIVNLNLSAAHKSASRYDATLRPIHVVNQDGSLRRIAYEPLLTKNFDENDTDPVSLDSDTPVLHHTDGLSRQIQTDELVRLNDDGSPAAVLKTWTTRYEYDLNDHLARIIDSQGNVKAMTHDGLGRLTFLNDPDRGLMSYTYDSASNLIETRDAKNQRITYTYDGANRCRTEDYHDEDRSFSFRYEYDPSQPVSRSNRADVVYFYDLPAADVPLGDGSRATAANTKGYPAYVWDLSGEEHTSYDQRGRTEYTLKRVSDPVPQQLVSFTTRFQYDCADRLTRVTFPDNDEITFQYNDRNLLERIPGGPSSHIISNITYLPSAQMERIRYGNGVVTSYDYDRRLRLTTLLTLNPQRSTELLHIAYDFDKVSNLTGIEDRRSASGTSAGDARRNTQLFRYDDLYRLTHVQYSFNLPGEPVRNDGEIDYRYDRVGNMLAQTSTIDHQENGLPVANLGEMHSGGSGGRFNRIGRTPGDPPGPHALTSITPPSSNNSPPRVYAYDANGNMTALDGLSCTWDFKDRLVTVESDNLRAEYTYDYTDRRIIKKATAKGNPSTLNPQPSTVIFVNRYFEVRDHGQPTKFVWQGGTRVARVIGSLSSNRRVQRLGVYPGWNLVSLAVGSTNTGAQLKAMNASTGTVIQAAYKWNAESKGYSVVPDTENLGAGTVLWLKASGAATLELVGTYDDPTDLPLTSGPSYYPGSGLETAILSNALPAGAAAWIFDPRRQDWNTRLGSEPDLTLQWPEFLPSGQSLFVVPEQPAAFNVPDDSLRVLYYHQDHLGSSSAVTDAQGNLIQETAFYPFGSPRIERRTRPVVENYRFTGKEMDSETGLHYFAARFLASHVGRFIRSDPLDPGAMTERLTDPQRLHPYSYAGNNPLARIDPLGLDFWDNVGAVGRGAWNVVETQATEAYDFVTEHPVETVIGVISAPVIAGPALVTAVGVGAYEATTDLIAAATGEKFGVTGGVTHYTGEQRYEQLGSGLVKAGEVALEIYGSRLPKTPSPKSFGPEAFAKTQPDWVVGKTQPARFKTTDPAKLAARAEAINEAVKEATPRPVKPGESMFEWGRRNMEEILNIWKTADEVFGSPNPENPFR